MTREEKIAQLKAEACIAEKDELTASPVERGVMHKKLVDGRIPALTECFWKDKCRTADACHHTGKVHPVPFSCAFARGFELIESGA